MTAAEHMLVDKTDNTLTLTRIIHEPRALVFNACTDPGHLAHWWGPRGFTNPVCKLDVRPGGAIFIHMRGPDGVVHPMTGVYREIVKPGRLVFTSAALDAKGNPLFEVLNSITFLEHDGNTKLIMCASVSKVTAEAAPYLKGMEEGWKQTIDRLDEHVTNVGR